MLLSRGEWRTVSWSPRRLLDHSPSLSSIATLKGQQSALTLSHSIFVMTAQGLSLDKALLVLASFSPLDPTVSCSSQYLSLLHCFP